nr:unnamed protein product [Callosobruchus chinensis]
MAHEKLNDFSLKDEWSSEWTNNNISNKNLIQDPSEKPEGFDLPRRSAKSNETIEHRAVRREGWHVPEHAVETGKGAPPKVLEGAPGPEDDRIAGTVRSDRQNGGRPEGPGTV